MKASEFQKNRWHTPYGVLTCMRQINEAFEYTHYDYFPNIVQEIMDRISDENYKCVCKTITTQTDSVFFSEMLEEVIKMGDTYLNIDASTYNHWCSSKDLSDRKKMVISDELERHDFKALYAMAKKYQNEKEL